MNDLSRRLQKALFTLQKKGMAKSDCEVARKIGVSYAALNMAKMGVRVPTWGMLLDLCDQYPINFGWLRTGAGSLMKEDREAALQRKIERYEKKIELLEKQIEELKADCLDAH